MAPNKLPVWAVIPAAGNGQRMVCPLPKQYLLLGSKTIIEQTLDRVLSHIDIAGAVLSISPNDHYWETLAYQTSKPLMIVAGGSVRQESVYNGLLKLGEAVSRDCYVLVHDAVRPLVSHEDISKVIDRARTSVAGAVLANPVFDSLKQQDDQGNITHSLEHRGLWRALTPQVFSYGLLAEGLGTVIKQALQIRDEASAVEAIGHKPKLVRGRTDNLKITAPEDLALAEHIWQQQSSESNQ